MSAVTVSSTSFITSPAIALGLCSALFTAAGLVVLEGAVTSNRDEKLNGTGGYVHANGSVLRRHSPQVTEREAHIATMRDVSVVIALACASGSLLLESYKTDGLVYRAQYSDKMGKDWRRGQRAWGFAQAFVMVVVGMVQNGMWVVMVSADFPKLSLIRSKVLNNLCSWHTSEMCSAFYVQLQSKSYNADIPHLDR